MNEKLDSLLTDFRETAPARFTPPPVELITRSPRRRPRRAVLGVAATAAGVVAIAAVPVVVFGGGERPAPPGNPPATDPTPHTALPTDPGRAPSARIDLQTFRTRLPAIVEPDGTGAPACPGGEIVFHSDGMNGATGAIGTTTYAIGRHPTMPDHYLDAAGADLDGDGVNEIVTTVACEPEGGRRTVNLYVFKRTDDGYRVLDVPVSDNRRFDHPRPILHGFGVTGDTLAVTLDELEAQPEAPPSAAPDGQPDNPREVVMRWNGKAFQPRVGDYRW